jgi:tetratricopeptide (TPR) repeat protein
MKVKAWREAVTIPTYEIGKPEKAPIFLEKRVYQGSSGVVYPYPVIEKVSDTKHDKIYNAIYLENEYIKVMILPELGGRVQMAYDKIKKRHFIYYNHVIKPALVGLTGPWISGGIEFNWPQHHRPSTFLPIDSSIETSEDGSVTVWVNEMERMFHQKGMAGFTLRPGKAYLEIKGRVYNRTDIPQTFLWWANPAVAVNDYYQSVFPPDVNAVFDHGRRDVSTFPIATGTYYKVDYSAGVDISNYKNIPVPTSYMAIESRFDFVGGYENDTHGGVLHIANHHISPGKKQWTWGNGDFGRAWDRNLTDNDGPYIELMAGVYTDNQPDFSWLQPYEEKSFVQYFLPYRELGVVKNATKDLLMNIEQEGEGKVRLKIFATSAQKVRICLSSKDDGTKVFEQSLTLSPEEVFDRVIETTLPLSALKLAIYPQQGRALLTWEAEKEEKKEVPEAAKAALAPEDTPSVEELYLTGLHIEQYRHATYNAADYYKEGLRREPSDARCNNALGLWYYRRGRYEIAEPYFRQAIATLTKRNLNPYDGEPFYNLGLALKMKGEFDEAYDCFYKSCWNAALQDEGYFACAQISVMQDRMTDALDELEHSLVRNWHNHKARHLKTAALRILHEEEAAIQWISDSLKIDPFNYGCMYEMYLLTEDKGWIEKMKTMMHQSSNNYEEIALDYAAAGLWQEAVNILKLEEEEDCTTPMTYYYMAWCQSHTNDEVADSLNKAAKHSPDYCFPNRLEAITALTFAMQRNPKDAKAPYYLGNLWYDKRQYPLALDCWKSSAALDGTFSIVWRNLALAYFNKSADTARAVECMERAFALAPDSSRFLMELDQLYKRTGKEHQQRLNLLNAHSELVNERDDLYLEQATILNMLGRYEEARQMIDGRLFHPWEGGEGKVTAQYQYSRVEMAKSAIRHKAYKDAIALLNECLTYPNNLGEGKLYGAKENDFFYLLGCAYQGFGDMAKAEQYWQQATKGKMEPSAAIFYNDQKPDKIFYQGMAMLRLGTMASAQEKFQMLLNYGTKHLDDKIKIDYFAVSLPDLLVWEKDLDKDNRTHCHYMMALGLWGLGKKDKAIAHLKEAASSDPEHQGVTAFQHFISIIDK